MDLRRKVVFPCSEVQTMYDVFENFEMKEKKTQ